MRHTMPTFVSGKRHEACRLESGTRHAMGALVSGRRHAVPMGTFPESSGPPPGPVYPSVLTNAWEPFRLTSVGDPVDEITDPIGGLTLTQANPAARGVLASDGAHNYIAMDDTNDEYYTDAPVDWTAGYTWFAVVRTSSLANYRNYIGLGPIGGAEHGVLFSSAGGAITLQRRSPSIANCPSANSTFAAGQTYMVTATTSSQVWLGRTSVATGPPNAPTSAQVFAVGRTYAVLSGGRINGRIYALYRAPAGLTVGERESVWDFIESELAGLV